MLIRGKVLLLVVAVSLVGCGGPKPAPATLEPQMQSTATLPPDGWFSIVATGRVSPSKSDVVVVYQSGLAIYIDENTGQQYQKQFDATAMARWQNWLVNEANIVSLKDSYPATTPQPDDSIYYTIFCRQEGTVKTIVAQKSGAPPELGFLLEEFWKLIKEIRATS